MQNKNNNSSFLIDLNEYTQNPNFVQLKGEVAGIYLRTSGSGSGSFKLDQKFIAFAKACIQNGIKTGGYHYGVPSYNLATADSQCDDFINALQQGYGRRCYGNFMPVLDIEEPTNPNMNSDVLLKWIDRFRKRFEKKTRRRLMLYVSVNFVQTNNDFKLSNGTYPLNNMPLWIAMYTWIKGNPEVPPNVGGWTKWRMWQYTDKQKVEGVENLVDANYGPNNIELLMQPGNVQNFNGKINKGNVCLMWARNKEINLAGYNIFVDNYWIGTVDNTITSYNIPIVKLYNPYGRNIVVSIEAFDIEGNVSEKRSKINLII